MDVSYSNCLWQYFCIKTIIALDNLGNINEAKLNKNQGSEFSARFINSSIYGTRSTTVMTIDQNDQVDIKEQLYNPKGKEGKTKQFNFKIL